MDFYLHMVPKLLIDKPDSFKIQNNGIYGEELDIYIQKCVYPNQVADAIYKKLPGLIDIFRKNPIYGSFGY